MGRGGLSCNLSKSLFPELSNLKAFIHADPSSPEEPPSMPHPEEFLPMPRSNQHIKGKELCTKPPTNNSLFIGTSKSQPLDFSMANSSRPSNVRINPSEPLLLNLRQDGGPFENPNPIDRYLQVVDKVVDALSQGDTTKKTWMNKSLMIPDPFWSLTMTWFFVHNRKTSSLKL